MAEELQHLLDAIRKEGVQKAEEQAEAIITEARRKARDIREKAEAEAKQMREEAAQDARREREAGEEALRQSGRDVVLAVGKSIEVLLKRCLQADVGEALAPDTLRDILKDMAHSYFEASAHEGPAHVYVAEKDEQALAGFVAHQLRDWVRHGAELHTSPRIQKGFRVGYGKESFYHDFTQEAIAEEMCRLLRPRLQAILRDALKEGVGT